MIGHRIRLRRKQMRLSQQELAKPWWTRSYVSQIELGKVVPPLESLSKLAVRLDTTVGDLIGDVHLLQAAKASLFFPGICESYLEQLPDLPTTKILQHLCHCLQSGDAPTMEIPPNPELHYLAANVLWRQQRLSAGRDTAQQGLRYAGPYWQMRLLILLLDIYRDMKDQQAYEQTKDRVLELFGKRRAEDVQNYLEAIVMAQTGSEASAEMVSILQGIQWSEEIRRARHHGLI